MCHSVSRRLRVAVAVVLLALTAGCLGGGSISDARLDERPPAPYEWDAGEDAHITVTENARFQAVYRVNGSSLELYRSDGFGGRNAIPVSALRYRYPDGTVINGSRLDERGGGVDRSRNEVNVTVPADAEGGKVAFTSASTPKRFSLPVFVEGSHVVVLPPNRDVAFPIFGSVSPAADSVERTADDRVRIRWNELSTNRNVVVQFYLERDLRIFAGIVAVTLVVGLGGLYRYRRQIERLREQREELGLDVETDDDTGDGPPPGMG